MSKLIIKQNEKEYMEGKISYLKSNFNVLQGTGFITSERFIFCKRSGLTNALLGPIFIHAKKGNIVEFEINYSDLKSINAVKHGFAKKYVLKTTNNKEFAIQFVSNKVKWLNTISMAVKEQNPSTQIKTIGDFIEFN